MKIVHIITRLILGGAQENTLFTCEGLHRRGHEVTLITGPPLGPEGQLMDRARAGGYRVIEIDSLRRAINPFYDLAAYGRIKKLLVELDADIVHTHSAKAGILGRRAAAAIRASNSAACCPVVTKMRQAQAAFCGRPRIIHTIHGLAFHPYQSWLVNRFYIAVERGAAAKTDCFISVAQAMTDQAMAAGVGGSEKFTRIFSGVETANYLSDPSAERIAQLRGELDIPSDAVVIATVARLFKLKGHEFIIESAKEIAARHKNVIWLFIGDGSWRGRIERQIAQAGLTKRFRLSGLVAPERVAELLHASDVLVHCSLREGLARALSQAMLCGKAVISFDVDGAREIVINGKTGFLIEPRDVAGLIEAQEKLISDSELRRKLGSGGRELCRAEFDHEKMADRIERVYKEQMAFVPVSG
ncbi:MAG: glycosyltransferase family 4 protein [Sedimentisphaerales bacterium]|nr:glycosyltransferase family 4 protein [Sedimentisphaerales bacterium]